MARTTREALEKLVPDELAQLPEGMRWHPVKNGYLVVWNRDGGVLGSLEETANGTWIARCAVWFTEYVDLERAIPPLHQQLRALYSSWWPS